MELGIGYEPDWHESPVTFSLRDNETVIVGYPRYVPTTGEQAGMDVLSIQKINGRFDLSTSDMPSLRGYVEAETCKQIAKWMNDECLPGGRTRLFCVECLEDLLEALEQGELPKGA